MKYIILVFFILSACSETQSPGGNSFSQHSTLIESSGESQSCKDIDTYYNCIMNHYPDFKKDMVSVNYNPDKTPNIGQNFADKCLKEQGKKRQPGKALERAQFGSDLVNKCKYQVTDYYSEYDFFVQMISCGKRETKKIGGCP